MEIRLVSVSYGALIGALAVLFVLSILYALILQWAERKAGFVSAYTWITVVIGVAYTLGVVAFLSPGGALLAFLAFGVASVPIIARSIYNDLQERQERLDRLERRR